MAGKSVPKVKQKLDKKDLTLSLAFLLPAILITVIFVIYPVFDTVGLSFRKWNGMFGAAKQWVGLENYQKIFSDKLFWNAMLNSVYFMIGGFVILMPLSFGLAMLVTAKIKGTGFFRTCYFLPNMLGTTAVALMWTFMLNPNFGIFNTIENIFGLHGTIPDVLTIKTVNVWIVVLVNEWMYAGYNMLIFAAGLVAIPDELNEAAALDGATGWQRIRYIILPLMKNSFKVFSILCITGCLKVFDIIWAMTRGGPNDISSTPSIMLYTQGFSYKLFGRSSAYGVILLVLGVVLSLITNHLFREDKDRSCNVGGRRRDDMEKTANKQKMHGGKIALYVIAILWTVVTLFPVVVTVMASFKTNSEIYLNLLSFPKKIMFQNYISANKTADALNTIKNSLVVATLTTVFNTVVGMMAAYILSRKDYKFLKWVYVFFMIGVMVPVHCTLIPINNIATALNAKNNLFFLILIYVAFGMSQAIFLYTGFMDGISRNLDEAAIIDGCNNWQLLWKILFPVCKPIIATEAIFVFIYGYSELVFSMILMTDTKYFTVSRAMLNFSSAHTQEIGSQFAYVVMSVIPMLIIYIVFHKQIEKGMLSGAIKG